MLPRSILSSRANVILLPPQCTVSANRISPLWCRAKQVLLNEEAYRCARRSVSGRFSGFAAVWMCSRATPISPYLGFKLKLDPAQLCEIIAQTNPDMGKRISQSIGSSAMPPTLD